MIIQCVPTSFTQQLLEGVHNFKSSGGDTFKIALYTSSANLDTTTTAYTTMGEVVGTGYTAGGATLTNLGTNAAGTTGYASFGTVTWSNSTITARGAIIYNSTATAYTNPAVLVLSFGIDRSTTASDFTISFPTNNSTNAIIRINAPLA